MNRYLARFFFSLHSLYMSPDLEVAVKEIIIVTKTLKNKALFKDLLCVGQLNGYSYSHRENSF